MGSRCLLALCLATWLAEPVAAASADPELAALKAELARLQARIEALEAARAPDPEPASTGAPVQSAPAQATSGTSAAPTKQTPRSPAPGAASELGLAGRIHTDLYAFDEDRVDLSGGAELRRARVEWHRQFGLWGADLVYELTGSGGADGLRDVLIHRSWGDSRFFIGQFKPLRSMAELTSSNNFVVPERPFLSASGVFSGRQFQQGLGFLGSLGGARWGLAAFSLRDQGTPRNDGWGLSGRLTGTPWRGPEGLLHLGGWISLERPTDDALPLLARAEYAGRRGPRETLARTLAGQGDAAVDALGLELAWQQGGWLLQSEIGRVQYDDGLQTTRLDSGYLQASYLFSGAQRNYKSTSGVFSRPTLSGPAWELAARLDYIGIDGVADGDVRSTVLGLNYHYSDQLHWLLSYTLGDSELSDDQTRQLALRTMLIF